MHSILTRRGVLLATTTTAAVPSKPVIPVMSMAQRHRRVLTGLLYEAIYSHDLDTEAYADALQKSHIALLQLMVQRTDPQDAAQKQFTEDTNTERILIESMVELEYADDPVATQVKEMYSRGRWGDHHVLKL